MNCRDVLERGAVACVECGTRVGMRNGNADTAGSVASCTPATNPSANRNTLTYKEDRNSRSFEASLTDSAMQGVAGVLQDVFTRAGARPPVITRHERQPDVIEVRGQLPPPSGQEEESVPPTPPANQPNADVHADRPRLLKLFTVEGERIELEDLRLKAKSARDYYSRLTWLFLYAQEILLQRSSTPRSELVAALTAAKVYDGNCRFWLTQQVGFKVVEEERMKLNMSGRESAVKVLNEALDANVEDKWNPDTKPAKAKPLKKSSK